MNSLGKLAEMKACEYLEKKNTLLLILIIRADSARLT